MLGPLMLGIEGPELLGEERERLSHPAVGGVLLFARNYQDPAQMLALTTAIKALRQPSLLIAVDQEGGRVQRFKSGLSTLPAARQIGQRALVDLAAGEQLAEQAGWLMAAELRALGVDLSFAPVLDVDYGVSQVIGDRSFGEDPELIARLALAWQRGARQAGMASVGKHFPGHGGVAPDSHYARGSDPRTLADLTHHDLLPFRRMIDNGIAGLMMAHLEFPEIDEKPVGFSAAWHHYLRKALKFEGAILSDDLQMRAAESAGDLRARAQAVISAGGDMAIVGNAGRDIDAVLDQISPLPAERALRLTRLHGRERIGLKELQASAAHQSACAVLARSGG